MTRHRSPDNDSGPSADPDLHGGAMRVSRSRGAISGIMLVVLGAWGALIPFIGPYFNFSYTPDDAWHWTAARFWLEVLPGAAAFLGGLLLLLSANRVALGLGAWLGVAAGAWFVVDRDVQLWFRIGSPGVPAGQSRAVHALESLALFSALGALILFFAASGLGRTSVRSVRDVRSAQRRNDRETEQQRDQQRVLADEQAKVRSTAYEDGRRDGLAEGRQLSTRTDGTDGIDRTDGRGATAGDHVPSDDASVERRP